jgi:hypothetical protein
MAFKVTVVELRPSVSASAEAVSPNSGIPQQVYEQTVDTLDLPKVIAAVNYKKRERKPRTVTTPRP